MKKMKLINKIAFLMMCILWIGGFVMLGIEKQNPIAALLVMCFASVVAIWQLLLNVEQINIAQLSFFVINLLLSNIAPFIKDFMEGRVKDGISGIGIVLLAMTCIIGIPTLIALKTIKNNKTFMSEGIYKEEIRSKKIKQSFGLARRVHGMSCLTLIFLKQTGLSFLLFLVTILGIDSISHYGSMSVRYGDFSLTRGIFVNVCMVFLLLFAITAMWAVIAYKRLEFIGVQMDLKLKGATDEHIDKYLASHGQRPVNKKVYSILAILLTIAQIALCIGEFGYAFL